MNILAKMLGMLTGAYNRTDKLGAEKGLPMETNIGRLFSVVSWGFGIIEENAERVRLWSSIDHAAGATLDRHGEKWGVARGGTGDVFYRLLIKVKILAQLSGGDIETIISAVAGLYEIDPVSVDLYELFPAKIQVDILEEALPADYESIEDIVWAMTKRLLVAGVGLIIAYKVEAYTDTTLYLGGAVVAEHTQERLADYGGDVPPKIAGNVYIGGYPVCEFTRIRLQSTEIE